MPIIAACALLALTHVGSPADRGQGIDDPLIRTAVERFFATQEAEDVEAYMALWSSRAQRPRPEQLKYIFDTGDDKFSDIAIIRVRPIGDKIVVQVSATRDRTGRRPDGTPTLSHSVMSVNLTFVREGEALKLIGEGPATDVLAAALADAASAAEREALLAADPDLVNDSLVLSLARRADAAVREGPSRMRPALAIYDLVLDVARRVGNRKMEGEALQNIGNSRYFLHEFPAALEAYERRLAIEREIVNDEGIAASLLGVATIRYSTYEYSAALTSYEEALKIQEQLQDDAGAAMTRISTGNVRYIEGDYEGAITEYRRSRDGWRKLANSGGETQALEGLGRVYAAQGDFAAALDAYTGVLAQAAAAGNRSIQGRAIQQVGEIHFRLGNLNTARSLFDESRAHFETVHDLANIGRVWQAAALTDLVAGRFAPAEQEYSRSSSACGAAQDQECVARAIVGLAFAQASQQHYDEAIATYGKAIAAFSALSKREEAVRAETGLAQALFGKKDYDAALAAAGRVRQQALVLQREDLLWRAIVVEARTLRRLKAPDKAMAAAKEATASVLRMSAAVLDRPGESVAEDATSAYALLAVLQAEAGDAAGALVTLEERRALALRIALARNERDIARGMTAPEREAERTLDAELVALNVQRDHERALPKPDAARLSKLEQSMADLTTRRRQAQQHLFERLPELRVWRGLGPPAGIADVTKVLTGDTVLAEFVIDEEDVLAITVAAKAEAADIKAFLSPIARQALAERISRALDPAVLRSQEEWRKASIDLTSAIPSAALDQIAASARVVLVPDDLLWHVPFEALPIKAGYLADQTTVTYATSLTSITSAPPAAVATEPGLPLVIGAPELSAAVRDRVKTTAPAWILRAPAGAEAEIRRVADGLQEPAPTVLEGALATEAAFRAQARAASLLHVAAPFAINGASPLFSPVLLAGEPPKETPDDPASDGVLEAREIMNLDLRAGVVVLSDGAATSAREAAQAVGTVQWAWRAAGVPALVLSRWAGDEAAGATLLGAMHAHLKQGETPEVALQAARAVLRARDETRPPYFWAGWMVIGRTP